MAAELVVAAAPFKVYPGGVVAFKCSEWLGDSAGASTESDARAIEGEVVRETQTTSATLLDFTSRRTAVAAADDSLTIDLAGVDFTATSQFDAGVTVPYEYDCYLSVCIEGTFDPSDTTTYAHTPLAFDHALLVAIFGDAFNPVASPQPHNELSFYPHRADSHYTMIYAGSILVDVGDEVLHVRALARNTTTIEVLLDQLVLLPISGIGGVDQELIEGGYNDDSFGATLIVDGPDGGDANGKFTWHPRRLESEPISNTIGDSAGGGDYQKEDSEYMIDVPATDARNFMSAIGGEQAAHVYSIHGSRYREEAVIDVDPFSRTVAGTFGATPKGYDYAHSVGGSNATPSADGSRGKIHFTGVIPRANGLEQTVLNTAPRMLLDNMSISGTFQAVKTSGSGAWWDGVTTDVVVLISFMSRDVVEGPALGIEFDILRARWRPAGFTEIKEGGSFAIVYSPGIYPLASFTDISSWYSPGDTVGFRLELKRFLMRAKIWDAGGAEPGTWGFEDFHPLETSHGVWVDYPYSDDEYVAATRQQITPTDWLHEIQPHIMVGGNGYTAQWDCYFDDLTFEADPYGDIGDVNAALESPKGTEVDRITVPAGAWHFVYWGKLDVTSPAEDDSPSLDLAMKVWSDAGAAELQRSEMPALWVFWQPAGKLVPMNWRYDDRSLGLKRIVR